MKTNRSHDLEEVLEVTAAMLQAGLPDSFVRAAVRTALDFEGVHDLLMLWRDEDEPGERDEIVADIQELIDDCAQTEKSEAAYIRFDDLEEIAKHVRKFKDGLLVIVNQRGGITGLAKLTGMPQPSLSRFFNTNAMPRRGTLLKIERALDLGAVKIATEWIRE